MFLWSDVIKFRTHIKILRRLGIVLIALPEPFTTPFGVALVLLSRYLYKRREASRNKRLQETVQYYLANTRLFSGDAYSESSAPGWMKLLSPSKEHALLGQITGSRSFEANLDSSTWQGLRNMLNDTVHHPIDMQSLSRHYEAGDSFRVESGWSDTSSRAEKVIYHTINWESLSRCYESESGAVAHSSLAHISGVVEGVTQHSVNTKLLSQRYQTPGAGEVKIQRHTINMASLMQRYGPAMYKMALQTR